MRLFLSFFFRVFFFANVTDISHHRNIYMYEYITGMIMNKVIFESSPNKYLSLWLSFVILKISNEGVKLKFREIERISLYICRSTKLVWIIVSCLLIQIYIYKYVHVRETWDDFRFYFRNVEDKGNCIKHSQRHHTFYSLLLN